MRHSMINKVKKYNWSMQEQNPFGKLLESLGLSDADVNLLAKPIEDAVRREARIRYIVWSVVALAAAAVVAFKAVSELIGIPAQKSGQLFMLWLPAAIACGVIYALLRKAFNANDADVLLTDRKKLLHMRFAEVGSMGSMLGELENKSGVVIYGQADKEDKPYSFLGPVTAKAAVLVLVVTNLVLGAATIRGWSTGAVPVQFGAVLNGQQSWVAEDGTLVIPAEYKGSPVTTIGKRAFDNMTDVKKVIVPDTVTSIESGAFIGCTGLEEIILPDSLTTLGAEVFSGCSSLKTCIIPAGVTEIRADLFKNCTSLVAVQLPDGITKMKAGAFDGCASLRSFELPAGVDEIPARFFQGCVSLEQVKLHYGLTTLGADVFSGCKALVKISLPEGLTKVPARAFQNCSALNNIVIPNSVQEIGAYAFDGCRQLLEVQFLSDMSGGKFSEGAFWGCTSLKSIQIPKGVTKLSTQVFYGCTALQEVIMPERLEENKISEGLFRGCSSLVSIVIPDGVKRISAHAFRECGSLSSVSVPATLSSIGSSAFRDCKSLKEITLPSRCSTEDNTFKGSPTKVKYGTVSSAELATKEPAVQTAKPTATEKPVATEKPAEVKNSFTVENGKATLYKWGYQESDDPSVAVVPAKCGDWPVVAIGSNAFKDRSDIRKVVLPDTVTTIENGAFRGCTQLMEINMPKALQKIGAYAFADCLQLTKITLPEGIITIGMGAFRSCQRLVEMNLPASLQQINSNAFADCISIHSVVLPAKCSAEEAFDPGVTVEITTAAIGGFKQEQGAVYERKNGELTVTGWYGKIGADGVLEVPATYGGLPVTEIGTGAFSGRADIVEVVLPETITVIQSNAFKGCSRLSAINMPSSLREIGNSAFAFCIRLQTVVLPEGLTAIGAYAFQKCKQLNEVYFPYSLERIGRLAFDGCPELTRVLIPAGCSANAAFDDGVTVEYRPEGMHEDQTAVPTQAPAAGGGVYQVQNGEAMLIGWRDTVPDGVVEIPAMYEGVPVTAIDPDALSGRTDIVKVVLPEGIQTIRWFTFGGCTALSSITVPDSLTSIEAYAFSGCKALRYLEVPKDCDVDMKAFIGCVSIKIETR